MKLTDESLLNLKQIAGELGMSVYTVRRWFKAGKLEGAFQAGGRGTQIRMPLAAVRRLKGCK
jgi:predicted site-specific integrase-resolvase